MIYYIFIFYLMSLSLYFFFMFLMYYIFKQVWYLEMELYKISSVKMEILILLDWISLLFFSVVLIISSMVVLYSIEYMMDDNHILRFMWLVVLFVVSMIFMIMSPNMLSILIGWDGLGLVSFCLVIFYQNEVSFNSGMVTVLTNRVGDILILILIALMLVLGSWNFLWIFSISDIMLYFLLGAAITKSAQIPFSSWLPMAMAAPTPVSSLVHSSTLVTAGVYLLIRFNYLMIKNNLLMFIMMFISLMTMFLSGLGANYEFDLKKIVALSTLSQLGVMIFSLSLGLVEVSFFHLLTHAMFKSLLFMCCGVIIHNFLSNQDIRMISMVSYNMPMISIFFNGASLSLCGIPFMSGFFSKDLILEMYMMSSMNWVIMIILFMSMGLTLMYSIRLVYYSFIKKSQLMINIKYKSYSSIMGVSMYLLFFFSIILGGVFSWLIFSFKSMIFLPMNLKLMIYFWMFLGLIMSSGLKFYLSENYFKFMNVYIKFFMMMWFMPLLYGVSVIKLMNFNNKMMILLENSWNEYFTVKYMMIFLYKYFKYDFWSMNYMYLFIVITFYIIFFLLIN